MDSIDDKMTIQMIDEKIVELRQAYKDIAQAIKLTEKDHIYHLKREQEWRVRLAEARGKKS